MPRLKPSEQFTISRHLDDPQDTNTYYVKAFIRDKRDDDVIDTVNLTLVGSGAGDLRYTGAWEVVRDGSGEGRWIVIITKVYTDSGYTTLSPLYGVQEREYLIQERLNANLHMGGGGSDVNYKKVRKIVEEELAKLPQPLKPVNLTPILNAIYGLPEATDLSPVLKAIQSLPEAPRLDLSPVITEIGKIPQIDYNVLLRATQDVTKAVERAIRASSSQKDIDILNKELKKLRKTLAKPVKLEMSRLKDPNETEEPKKRRVIL